MKALITISIICCSVYSSKAQTNVYHPFPLSNAIWRNTNSDMCGSSTVCYIDYQYRPKGDTTYNGKKYTKFYIDVSYANCPCTPNSSQSLPGPGTYYYSALRNDTLNKRVYQIGIPEKLLYDFDLKIGDSLLFCPIPSPIVKIDSVIVGSTYRKRFISKDSVKIIEGVGYASFWWGDLFHQSCLGALSPYTNFVCFAHNSDYYPMGNGGCGSLLDSKEINLINNMKISPNPSNGLITMSNLQGNNTIEVYDITGRVVYSEKINTNSKEIDLTTQPKGIYFYKAINENQQSQQGKLIIQ